MSARSGSPTIVDVAREAGVSIKTVSRVLNHEPGVHESTRDQVLKVVEALRYRPKQSARSLAGGRSFLIGLLYYDPSAIFVGSVQQGATLRCRELGYHLVVESLHNDAPDLRQQIDRMVLALRPDGMILTPPLCDNPEVLAALRESGTPCVLMSPERDIRGVPSVRMDDVRAAEEITNLLLSLGHRRIAIIKGPPDQSASAARYQGFVNALRAHDIEPDSELVQPGAFTFASGRDAAHKLLSGRQRPTAVFASNDDMALGVLAAAHRLGLNVPGELSVVGFDDSPTAALVWPPLTTVRQPVAEMARAAVEMLVSVQRPDMAAPTDDADLHKVLPHELVVRDSTRAR
ncbi:LacI family DNA-binding transcriptional regulator [Roseateles saccharophilus]|uniref:LacI family transcriptional regulator n=1 Tax=Roseateles saccharophilus TaxID=304 RepID=A0A4R3U9M5_ROSSA|nr:LacI family DNA-binding transcriptional regulator [Roseateles saccharophilus]MDG0835943.1 LacI family DNA-binding transcriptional regulator [Roseateles saccharophilus]TCU84951.1 LacI family transcriptional regulator [Roseateles saccharophilus]